MIDITPHITGLQPENTVRIRPIGGGFTGISDNYEIIVLLGIRPIGTYNCTAELTIINSGFYRFENDEIVKSYPFVANQQGQELRLGFRIKNRGRDPISLELTVCTYENASGAGSKLCSNGLFPVVIEHANATITTFS